MDRVRTIPGTFGADLPKENYAEMVNQGCEFLVRHDNKIGNFTYYVSGNFSFARNHYTKIDESAMLTNGKSKQVAQLNSSPVIWLTALPARMQTWLVYLNITVDSTGQKEISS